jgi:hypothetical protein
MNRFFVDFSRQKSTMSSPEADSFESCESEEEPPVFTERELAFLASAGDLSREFDVSEKKKNGYYVPLGLRERSARLLRLAALLYTDTEQITRMSKTATRLSVPTRVFIDMKTRTEAIRLLDDVKAKLGTHESLQMLSSSVNPSLRSTSSAAMLVTPSLRLRQRPDEVKDVWHKFCGGQLHITIVVGIGATTCVRKALEATIEGKLDLSVQILESAGTELHAQ